MKKSLILLVCTVLSIQALSQLKEFPMGRVTVSDVEMKSFPADTSASAVVLLEQGQAYFDNNTGNLIFEHYQKIKILNKNGFKEADFAISLDKNTSDKELCTMVKASTFNLAGTSIRESKYDESKKFIENHTGEDLQKFTLPDVHEGSVIEVSYRIESPFVFTFRTWEFQSELPKLKSEYTTLIPANYLYNITLRGFMKLTTNDAKLEKDCFSLGSGMADCSLTHYGMENIPAFKPEDYMTSEKNFISALYFDLAEVRRFSGGINKIQKDWKEVDNEMIQEDRFGKQIKKAKNILEDKVKEVVGSETDELKKAKLIYDFIKSWYTWDEYFGMYTHAGAKDAFEKKKGSSGDINLSMVAALQDADLKADPVILSTRGNGQAVEIQPRISGFNYVVASVEIAGTRYLLDGTNQIQPFGMLPEYCLNGRGRLIGKESSWIDIKPKEKQKTTVSMDLTMGADGQVEGKISVSYFGYDALETRTKILSSTTDAYLKNLHTKWGETEITDYVAENTKDIDKPLIEKAFLKMAEDGASNASTIFLNPFFINRIEKNPFRSAQRNYPVDYGSPLERLFFLTITFPESMVVDELPKNIALVLPQAGGKYLFSTTQLGNKLSIISNLSLTRSVYNPEEYHYLKELYARIIQIQQSQIVFKRK